MKLQRIISLGLAAMLILLISGCGTQKTPDATTTEAAASTTAATEITTTEAPTTTRATAPPTTAPGVELRQQVLDLDDKVNAAIKSWLEEIAFTERPSEYPMRNNKTVVGNSDGLFLRNDKTGKETLLLEAKWDDPYEEHNESPYVAHQLDDRYFVYIIQGWEWHAGAGIYDTKRMKAIPIRKPNGRGFPMYSFYRPAHSDALYLIGSDYEIAAFAVYRIDLSKLNKAETLSIGENLLKDVPEAQSEELQSDSFSAAFSPDGRYCAVPRHDYNSSTFPNGILAVFDLYEKAFVFQMERPGQMSDYYHGVFDDSNTLYVYGKTYDDAARQWEFAREVLEIKFH